MLPYKARALEAEENAFVLSREHFSLTANLHKRRFILNKQNNSTLKCSQSCNKKRGYSSRADILYTKDKTFSRKPILLTPSPIWVNPAYRPIGT